MIICKRISWRCCGDVSRISSRLLGICTSLCTIKKQLNWEWRQLRYQVLSHHNINQLHSAHIHIFRSFSFSYLASINFKLPFVLSSVYMQVGFFFEPHWQTCLRSQARRVSCRLCHLASSSGTYVGHSTNTSQFLFFILHLSLQLQTKRCQSEKLLVG